MFFNYVLKEVLWLLRETVKCGVADRGQLILHGSWNFRASAFSCLGAKVPAFILHDSAMYVVSGLVS